MGKAKDPVARNKIIGTIMAPDAFCFDQGWLGRAREITKGRDWELR